MCKCTYWWDRFFSFWFFPLFSFPQYTHIQWFQKKTCRYYNVHFCLTSLCWKLSNITLKLVILHLELVYLFCQLTFCKRVFPCCSFHFYFKGSIRRKLHFRGIHVNSGEITESAKKSALRLKSNTCLSL